MMCHKRVSLRDVPVVGSKGPPGLGSKATHRRQQGRIMARLCTRRRAAPAYPSNREDLSSELVAQVFWRCLCDEVKSADVSLIIGLHQLHHLKDLLRCQSAPSGGHDGHCGDEHIPAEKEDAAVSGKRPGIGNSGTDILVKLQCRNNLV